MNSTSPVVSAVTDAIATGVGLIGQFNDPKAHPAVTAELFERLRCQLGALPLDQAANCYYVNAVDGCERLAAGGEPRAARRQLVLLIRKLKGDRARWEEEWAAPRRLFPGAAKGPTVSSAADGVPEEKV